MDWFWSSSAWPDLFTLTEPVGEKILRPIAVYITLLLLLRLVGRRDLAQVTPLAFVLFLMLANTVQNAIIGDDSSLSGGIIGAAALIAFHELLSRTVLRGRFGKFVYRTPAILVRNGQIQDRALKHESYTVDQLDEEIRSSNVGVNGHEDCALVEISPEGHLTVIPRTDATMRTLLDRLDTLERKLDTLTNKQQID